MILILDASFWRLWGFGVWSTFGTSLSVPCAVFFFCVSLCSDSFCNGDKNASPARASKVRSALATKTTEQVVTTAPSPSTQHAAIHGTIHWKNCYFISYKNCLQKLQASSSTLALCTILTPRNKRNPDYQKNSAANFYIISSQIF